MVDELVLKISIKKFRDQIIFGSDNSAKFGICRTKILLLCPIWKMSWLMVVQSLICQTLFGKVETIMLATRLYFHYEHVALSHFW